MTSKINGTPGRCIHAHFDAIQSILTAANLFAHNNMSGQISLQSAAVNCNLSDTFVGTFISVAMVHWNCYFKHLIYEIELTFIFPQKLPCNNT